MLVIYYLSLSSGKPYRVEERRKTKWNEKGNDESLSLSFFGSPGYTHTAHIYMLHIVILDTCSLLEIVLLDVRCLLFASELLLGTAAAKLSSFYFFFVIFPGKRRKIKYSLFLFVFLFVFCPLQKKKKTNKQQEKKITQTERSLKWLSFLFVCVCVCPRLTERVYLDI